MILRLKIIASSTICLSFLAIALYGLYSDVEGKYSVVGLSAGFGLGGWMKWTEHYLQIQEHKDKKSKKEGNLDDSKRS